MPPFKFKPKCDVKEDSNSETEHIQQFDEQEEILSYVKPVETKASTGVKRHLPVPKNIQSTVEETPLPLPNLEATYANNDPPIEDLAFRTMGYPPISVPFYRSPLDPEVMSDYRSDLGVGKTPQLEKSKYPADIFVQNFESYQSGPLEYREDELSLLQFPKLCPKLRIEEEGCLADPELTQPFDSLPDGRIGVMQVYKSGQMKLIIGGQTREETEASGIPMNPKEYLSLKIQEGPVCRMDQEIVYVLPDEEEMLILGSIEKRGVLSVDIGCLLDD